MPIKDNLTSIFIKNFIIPRAQVIDKPGFIVFKMAGKSNVYSRQVIFSENFLINFENSLIENFGESAKNMLYSSGKKFGFLFGVIGNFYNVDNIKEQKKFVNYVGLINKFIEGTYASKMSFDSDMSVPIFNFYLDNFIVCNKSGTGFFLPTGAAAGLLCYLLKRKDIEGVQINCQGRGDKLCKIVYSSRDYFLKNKISFFDASQFEEPKIDSEYVKWNQIQPSKHSSMSFQSLINNKFFTYSDGIIKRNDERYFIFETSGIYLLETELSANLKYFDVLFEVSKKYGVEIFDIGGNSIQGLSDLLTAFGWGDVNIFKKSGLLSINIDFFPWGALVEKANFAIIRGILEGALSKIEGRNVTLSSLKKSFSNGCFSMFFSE